MRLCSFWIAAVVSLLCQGASVLRAGEAEAPSAEQIEFFEKRIRPLLANHCYRCHSKQTKKLRGDLSLDSRMGLHKGGASRR